MAQGAPLLSRMLRHARRVEAPPRGLDSLIADSLGLSDTVLPWAEALRRACRRPQREGHLLRFRLLHIRADISNAVAHPLLLDDEDSSRLINDLNDEFQVDSHFDALAPGDGLLWLRTASAPPRLPHARDILGQPLAAWAERQRQHRETFRLHNEMQMFLHLHPLNRQREQQGLPIVNGLWYWGAGDCRRTRSDLRLFSDDAEIRALGDACAGGSATLSELAGLPRGEAALVVWTGWLRILQEAQDTDPALALKRFDREAIRPLLSRRRPFQLLTGDGSELALHPLDRLRFWHKADGWEKLEPRP